MGNSFWVDVYSGHKESSFRNQEGVPAKTTWNVNRSAMLLARERTNAGRYEL